jgi:hypothetical protein
MQELGGKEGLSFEKIKEMLGFDPFQEIHGITISASDYEHPERSLVACVQLQKTIGNLEGLLLGLPGYEAKEYGKHQLYSVAPERDLRVFGAVHTGAQGDKTIVLSVKHEAVTNLLDQLDGKPASGSAFKKISLADGKPTASPPLPRNSSNCAATSAFRPGERRRRPLTYKPETGIDVPI